MYRDQGEGKVGNYGLGMKYHAVARTVCGGMNQGKSLLRRHRVTELFYLCFSVTPMVFLNSVKSQNYQGKPENRGAGVRLHPCFRVLLQLS